MFTGIIENIGTVVKITNSQIAIQTKLDDIKLGDSISVNGVCLTAVKIESGALSADYSPQTDKITTLSSLKAGDKVNLERALQLSSRLGGHIISGHVDDTAKIVSVKQDGKFFKFDFAVSKKIIKQCVEKGSIAIDGISLTISDISPEGFRVFIIPETINSTILKFKKSGNLVNIETDVLAKYVQKFLEKKDGALSLEFLKENGF